MYTDRIKAVIGLVNQLNNPICAEVGVWKGELSFILLKECKIDKYFMIDPLMESQNNFEYNSSNSDFPKMMNNNRYICNMNGNTLLQRDFDNIYNGILSRIHDKSHVSFIRESSKNAVLHFEDESLDFVFIDAIHLYEHVKEDIALWYPKIKPGGILAGDDYSYQFPGVISAVDEVFNNNCNINSTIWSIKK